MNYAKIEHTISVPKPSREVEGFDIDSDQQTEYEKLKAYRNALAEIALERSIANPAQERADEIRMRRRGY